MHRSRRACDACHGGQIAVSNATHAILAAEPPVGLRLHDLGEVRLAGSGEAERLFQVVADGLPGTSAALRAARP